MSTETKTFHIGDILSITTGALVSPRHIGGVYDILGWLVDESLFTHQLPRVARECEEFLIETFPDLPTEAPTLTSKDEVFAWLDLMSAEHGETREVPRMREVDHTHIDPLTEIKLMRPDAEVLVMIDPNGDGCGATHE